MIKRRCVLFVVMRPNPNEKFSVHCRFYFVYILYDMDLSLTWIFLYFIVCLYQTRGQKAPNEEICGATLASSLPLVFYFQSIS